VSSQKDQDDDGSKILVWVDGKGPRRYAGVAKYEPLTAFFGRLLLSLQGGGDGHHEDDFGGLLLVDQDGVLQHSAEDL